MRKLFIPAIGALALVSAPAMAQGNSGGAGGGGMGNGGGVGNAGGMGGSMGNPMGSGPPMSVPGRSAEPRGAASDIASQRGQFGRDHAQAQGLDRAEQARMLREVMADYRGQSEDRRQQAFAMRDNARQGNMSGMSARDIRRALREDMEEWREAFNIARRDWQAQRDLWLVDRESLTAQEWAERRASWFEARDAWIAAQVERAQDMENDPE